MANHLEKAAGIHQNWNPLLLHCSSILQIIIRKYDLSEMSHTADNHDEMACPSIVHLSEFKEAAISYIAGFVAQMGTKQLICAACCIALGSRKGYTSSNFIQLKDRGNLFKPTSSVIRVCKETEKCIQRMVLATDGKLPTVYRFIWRYSCIGTGLFRIIRYLYWITKSCARVCSWRQPYLSTNKDNSKMLLQGTILSPWERNHRQDRWHKNQEKVIEAHSL